ncbi:hypothetical protein NM208_g9008 [Fusarium decemcellulare]|uniref:Uncharacterized protein n=1 Tax=Fusarium decemcellulare TaxID=57161 RepID=A0ACC1S3F1_9HYPO|nr:hypothetical protein NM208_g9008 [Fusarium decemcellulare]
MGHFDCYCAICGTLLYADAEIGSGQPHALKRRRELVQKWREGLVPSDEEMADESDHESEPNESEDWDGDEDRRYDPDLVSEASLAWLDDVSCLGHNALAVGGNANTPRQRWVSRVASYRTFLVDTDLDPNEPAGMMLTCYNTSNREGPAVFPLHKTCYGMLEKVITSVKPSSSIDQDVLYDAMTRLSHALATSLDINYGQISGQGHSWEPIPGEEFSVTNPNDTKTFYGYLRERTALGIFNAQEEGVALGPHGQGNDPFSRLPSEMIRTIVDLTPGEALLNITSVSRPFYHDARASDYWKSRISSDMPWLDDLSEPLADSHPELDYRKLYIWLNTTTEPRYGIESPFLAIANRRRIWDACAELSGHYYTAAKKQVAMEPDPEIVQQAECPLLLKVAPTHAPRLDRIHQTWWTHSWEEINDSALDFETFWNDDKLLVGIGVVIGKSRRIFGTTSGRKTAFRIPTEDWISGMVLYLGDKHDSGTGSVVGIRGVNLELESKDMFTLGDVTDQHRPLLVSEDRSLVGVEGQIRQDGVIARIGFLECPSPQQASQDVVSPPTVAQKLIWERMIPFIWRRPDIEISPVFPLDFEQRCPEDDLSIYEILCWIRSKNEFERLCRITGHTPHNKPDSPLLGLRSQYIKRYWEPIRHIGSAMNWPKNELTHLTLDVENGEKIIAVGVNESETLKGIMLRTNKNQKVVFGQGETDLENWRMIAPPEGSFIMGVAATFEFDANTREKGKLSSLLIIHQPLDRWSDFTSGFETDFENDF